MYLKQALNKKLHNDTQAELLLEEVRDKLLVAREEVEDELIDALLEAANLSKEALELLENNMHILEELI